MKNLKPLNTFLYIKNNPKKIIPIVLTVSLGVFLIYFISMLGGGIRYELNTCIMKPYEIFSAVSIRTDKSNVDKLYDNFSQNKNVEKVIYYSNIKNIPVNMVVDSTGARCIYCDKDDIKFIMKKFNFNISNGRMPQNKNEIVFNERYARQKNIKIGDYYGSDVNSKDELFGKYKLVGTYKSDIIMAFVCDAESQVEMKKKSYGILMIAKDGHINSLNSDIERFSKNNPKKYYYEDYNVSNNLLSRMFSMFNVFAVIILGITVFVVTFTIGDISYVHFSERLPEFSMLEAIGCSKSEIIKRQLLETAYTIFIGFIVGIALSLLLGYIFDQIYCEPKGIVIKIISPWYILLAIFVPILVSIFSCLSVRRRVNKMQMVDVLEGNI